jgi:signal transduction histidine kinase
MRWLVHRSPRARAPTAGLTTAAMATQEALATEIAGADEAAPAGGRSARLRAIARRLRWVPSRLRTRILAWFIGFLTLATVATVLVTREVLLIRLDQRIDEELVQESAELRRLAVGNDPETGRRFGTNVGRIFEVFLRRNVPSRHEALITFVNGEPFLRSRQVVPYRLDRDRELIARWAHLRESDRGRVDTPAGAVEYLAVPLRTREAEQGVFVAAIFRDRAKAEVDAAVRATAGVGLAVLLLGSLLAWRLADRLVGPITALTQTARSITEPDLTRRIPVGGRDEVGQLAATFNEMLDRLERAFASQRRFIDDAGHELRTPLTIVRGHLELLEKNSEAQRETVALVLDELDRMARIVDDLLVLAKHDRPDFLNLATVEVGSLTDELHAKVGALAPREWILEQRGRGVIVADRQRLTQALVQLAQNAVHYSSEAEPVSVGSSVVDGEARFWVRDRGPGIAEQEQRNIFERFRRGSADRRSEGAGLGLAIVKAIAAAHRGRVELDSRPGAGATFTIVVPVDQPVDESTTGR